MSMEPMRIGGGRYELGALLGRGGMAEVRSAQDLRLGRTVAIKRLRSDLAADPTFQARFRREAQSAASLNHPAIVAVYDTGEELATDGTGLMLPYIVMEYVEGRTLRDILREGRRILPQRALEIAGAVLDALDYSHRAGIIHRDIKPANVMLTPTGDVKVMDFGIARAIADSSATMTQTAAVVGTAQYLSPEQARGEQVDARSDLYSAGCLLFELLTGRPPFVGDSPVSVAYQHVREEAAAPSTLDRDIPPEVDAITLKALAKRVDERYQSAAEMRADIDRALDGRPVHAPAVYGAAGAETEHFLPPAPNDPTPTAVVAPVSHRDEPPPPRRTWLWVLLLLLLAAAVIAALIAVPKLLADDEPTQVDVPRIVGMTVDEARQALEDQGLTLGQETQVTTGGQRNHIIEQDPVPETPVDEGTAVDYTVVVAPKKVPVPFVTDGTLAEAEAELKEAGLTAVPQEDPTSTERKNQVTRTDPEPGTRVNVGSSVTVFYSPGFIEVKNVVGLSEEDATQILEADNFNVVSSSVESDAPAGTVVAQDPEAGSKEPFGSTVVINVSLGPTEPTEPTTPPTSPTTPTDSTATTAVAPKQPVEPGRRLGFVRHRLHRGDRWGLTYGSVAGLA
jgi:beta-lactam-binding protein with PASTA domain/predicted Ser/Thr protein kinase